MPGEKVQGWVPPYIRWVIQRVVALGLYEGVSESDVVSTLLKQWVRDNEQRFARHGITESQYLLEKHNSTSAGGGKNVFKFKPREGGAEPENGTQVG